MTTTGQKHPLTDTAHSPEQCYFMGLITGNPYFESLEHSFAMVHVLTKSAKDGGRLWGNVASGQVRAWAWAIRKILHLHLMSQGDRRQKARAWLSRVITAFVSENATPGGKFYRSDHLFGTMNPRKAAGTNPMFQFIPDPEQPCCTMWFLSVFSHVLHQCLRAGIEEARPALLYSLGIQQGWWEAVKPRSKFLCAWANTAVAPSGLWKDHAALTFQGMTTPPTSFSSPIDMFYLGVYRSACLAAKELGQAWGAEAVAFIDANIPLGKSLPVTWAFSEARG
jgi:hypothetical protein